MKGLTTEDTEGTERATPETDDQPTINAINDNGYQVPCVDIEFARKLERERDKARIFIIGLELKWKLAVEMTQKAEEERDEAREEVARLRESLRCLLNPQCDAEEAEQ